MKKKKDNAQDALSATEQSRRQGSSKGYPRQPLPGWLAPPGLMFIRSNALSVPWLFHACRLLSRKLLQPEDLKHAGLSRACSRTRVHSGRIGRPGPDRLPGCAGRARKAILRRSHPRVVGHALSRSLFSAGTLLRLYNYDRMEV